ncbi:MAG: FGGY-family carbohydrate kinase [Geminicoccaceae bacterium]
MPIAVLDVGKTNAKAILLDEAGEPLAQRSRACAVRPGPPYPHLDLDGLWDWALTALRELTRLAPIDCIVPVAHGAAGVLMAGDRPALPALDYEHPGPDAAAAALLPQLDPFTLTGSPVLPLGLCLGAQLDWQERSFPTAFAAATDFLLLPQYWAWRLCGVKATEVTSLGAHTHLWRPEQGHFSGFVRRRGWERLFPPLQRAWERLGPIRPEVAAATGLPTDCAVLVGIHDSNASFLPHLLARPAPFTVLSTGTWIIAMSVGVGLDRLDEAADMLANVDARGDPVPTARFMGGREVEVVAGADALQISAGPAEVASIVTEGVMALPSFVPGSGPFIGRRGRILGEPGPEPARRVALASLYAALTVDVMLDKLGAAGPVLVEGSFHRNEAFCGLLAALRPAQAIHATDDPSGTARGAWLLAHWPNSPVVPTQIEPAVQPWQINGLTGYRGCWRAASYAQRR